MYYCKNAIVALHCFAALFWTAPELLRDLNALPKGTQKGDIYSFAIILTELLHRTSPFSEETDITMMQPKGTWLHKHQLSMFLYSMSECYDAFE